MSDKDKEHFNARAGSSYAASIGITHRTTPLQCSWTGDMRVRYAVSILPIFVCFVLPCANTQGQILRLPSK